MSSFRLEHTGYADANGGNRFGGRSSMAKDIGDVVKAPLGPAVKEATKSVGGSGRKRSNGPLSGGRGLAAGAGLAALAPLASKGAGALLRNRLGGGGGGDAP